MTYRGPVDSQVKKLLRDDAPRLIRRSAFLACAPVRIIVATDVVGDTFEPGLIVRQEILFTLCDNSSKNDENNTNDIVEFKDWTWFK